MIKDSITAPPGVGTSDGCSLRTVSFSRPWEGERFETNGYERAQNRSVPSAEQCNEA